MRDEQENIAKSNTSILLSLERVPESYFLRAVWREMGSPKDPAGFVPEVDLEWVLTWSSAGASAGPEGQVLECSARYGLYICKNGLCHVLEIRDGSWDDKTARVLVGAECFEMPGLWVDEPGEDQVFSFERTEADGAVVTVTIPAIGVDPARRRVAARQRPGRSAQPPGAARRAIGDLKREVVRIAPQSLERSHRERERGEWPLELCRFALPSSDPDRDMCLFRMFDAILVLAGRSVPREVRFTAVLDRPARDRTGGQPRMFIEEEGHGDPDAEKFVRQFEEAVRKAWPDGWSELWGPDRIKGKKAQSVFQSMKKSRPLDGRSSHALMNAMNCLQTGGRTRPF